MANQSSTSTSTAYTDATGNARSGNRQIADESVRLMDKLSKILELSKRAANEAEAAVAASLLQRFLTEHNLDIADLERKGAAAPEVHEQGHDLGKAAFTWKLNLAEAIARHYYCHALVNRSCKTVAFVGRPDNVQSLTMLYSWVIDQIKQIAAEERRNHFIRTEEEIDPLRWQVNFGVGAVSRLAERLQEQRDKEASEAGSALVLHHQSEISDYLEKTRGYRTDGRATKREQEWAANDARLAALKETDPEAYYAERPWDRPETDEQKAEREKADAEYWKKERRNAKRRTGRTREARVDHVKEGQARSARRSGAASADRVNLKPFVTGQTINTKAKKVGK